MKKFIFLLLLTTFVPSIYAQTCDQNFASIKIRAGSTQYFQDAVTNDTGYPIGVQSDGVDFSSIYAVGSPFFQWTTNMVNNGYIVPNGASNFPMFVSDGYVVSTPMVGAVRKSDAINVIYKIRYWEVRPGNIFAGPVTHTECQPYEVTWCGDGVVDVDDGEQCDGTAGTTPGTNTCNASCQLVTPPPVTPLCNPAKTGTQTSPVLPTDTLCSAGTPTGFASTVVGTTTNYTWSCIGNGTQNCSANYTPGAPTPSPDLSIKKYAKYLDNRGDTQTTPIRLQQGEAFSYYYTIENTGAIAATEVIVKDTFPEYISWNGNITVTNPAGTDVTADWTCVKGISPGTTRVTLVCTKNTPLPERSGKYTFTVPVRLDIATPTGTSLHNVAYICASNDDDPAACTPTPPPPPPPRCDDTLPTDQLDPACVQVGGNFDLSLKKYVKGDDVFAGVSGSEKYDYNIIVTNNGTGSTTGLTTVRDRLPAPITLQSGKKPSGNGWDCSSSVGADIICTTTAIVPAHQVFETITVPVDANGLTYRPEAYVNYAYVYNPEESTLHQCRRDGGMPDPSLGGANGTSPTSVCDLDSDNFDPATVSPPNPNGFDLMLHKYVNGDDEASRPNADQTVNYTFVVRNLGLQPSTGVTTVRDTSFPAGITPRPIQTTQGIWTCRDITGGFECTTDTSIAKDTDASTISLQAVVSASIAPGTYQNVACLSNPGDPHQNAPYDPTLGQYKVNNCNPANVIVVPTNSFDLTIVKKVGNNLTDGTLKDRNTALEGNGEQSILVIGRDAPLVYTFEVKNLGPSPATGITRVEDTLPEGITISGSVDNQNGWTCMSGTNGNRSWSCTRQDPLALGASFPTIIVYARSGAATVEGIYSNIATVSNPGDTNPTNNTDPANVKIIVAPTCGSLTANPNTSPNDLNTPITYTCAAVGYSGPATNLEYKITCGGSDLGWSASNTRTCNLPSTYATNLTTTCAVRDKITLAEFAGSNIGSCSSTLRTIDGGGVSGSEYFAPSCANSIPSCAYFANLTDCQRISGTDCRTYTKATCEAWKATASCGGGGGPPSTPGRCGDGVLQPSGQDHRSGTLDDEECDAIGSSSCSSTCKFLGTTTNPGANPLTDIWITIPTLSNARLGYSWLDGAPGKVAFSENKMVVGNGTKLFTLADTIGFGVKTEFKAPLIIESDKKIYLSSTGAGINSKEISTTFGRYASSADIIEICGKKYVVMGIGYYQKPDDCLPAPIYTEYPASSPNNITLFKGSDLYTVTNGGGNITLNTAFQGAGSNNSTGSIILSNGSSLDPLTYIPLVRFDVGVSSALVGSTAGTVNRKLESYIQAGNLANLFLSGIKSNTTTTANTRTTANNAVANVNVGATTVGDVTIRTISDLNAYKLNGNPNIFSIKGNVTIDSCANSTFTLDGVRTLIVEGDLIIKCNIVYASNDTTSSWAFIVKNGNIQVYNGAGSPNAGAAVTNLAGVYVATTGNITYTGATTTQAILKIDGSLYGKAQSLFDSRLYVRGTNAYEILTTGVVLSYSNRALVSPPPLLSSYLNNYSVTQVVK